MADGISITDLEQKTEVTDNDNFAVDNGAITNKVTAKQIKDYMGPTYVKKSGDSMTGALKIPTPDFSVADNTAINREWAEKKELTRITNCITKIPQDIKLELSADGVLTLKAGSKLYIPNGVGTFNEVTTSIDYDLVLGTPTGIRSISLVANSGRDLGVFVAQPGLNSFSGYTQPTVSSQTAYWYDTANNLIKRTTDTGSSWKVLTNATLPICIATFNAGVATSIDQVFNGLGHMGKTVFVLPGLEYLISNGRNADGSLNNKKGSITSVKILNEPVTSIPEIYIVANAAGGVAFSSTLTSGNTYYDPVKNLFFANNKETGGNNVPITIYSYANGQITLNPKPVFHAVDYFDCVSKYGDTMRGALNVPTPSSSANDTTVPTTAWVRNLLSSDKLIIPQYTNRVSIGGNTTFTAPSNGVIVTLATSGGDYVNCQIRANNSTGNLLYSHWSGDYNTHGQGICLPVRKGDTFWVNDYYDYEVYFYPAQ